MYRNVGRLTEVEEALAFIRKHINKAFIITGNPAREERWDYPPDALREIVMNMVVHRDYSHHGDSSIKIFNDRIEFFNPGRLPDSISEEDLQKGAYVSNCRNKLIAKIFKEITWIERYGTGIRRVTTLFENYGCPKPVFENFQHGFKVTAYSLQSATEEKNGENSSKVDEGTENVPENVIENVPENRLNAIIKLIENHSEISMLDLSNILQVNHKTIKRDVEKLKAKGLLKRIGPDKGGYWKISQNT